MELQIEYFRGRTIIATLTDEGWTACDATTGFPAPFHYTYAFAAIEEVKIMICQELDGWSWAN
jgi:hypothetical protein